MPHVLQLTLFGSPEVRFHGQPVTGFRSSKAQALLYYLAVTGRPHTRSALTGLFWGDQPEDAARTSLSKCLSNLRDLVDNAVLVDRQTVAFNRHQPYHLDTEGFLAGIGQPPTPETIPALQAALALYRGDFLEGFYVREAPDFEQWVLIQRAHYREVVVQGLHTLSNWYDQQGDLASAITHTRHLLTLEPWREEAHRQLMTRLARSGQRAAALAQFETCRRVLEEELAVEPDAETLALVENIRIGSFDKEKKGAEPAIQNPQPIARAGSLQNRTDWGEAPDVSQFHGRQPELLQLRQWLVADRCRMVTVLGMGGQGKTLCATMAATQIASEFVCVIWRSLRNAPPVEELLGQCIQIVETDHTHELPAGVDKRIDRLLAHLQQQRCLLIFDNFETVLQHERVGSYRSGYEGYGQLLQRIGEGRHQSCLLLTSREKPRELITLASDSAPVRTLSLVSLTTADSRVLLAHRGLTGSDGDWTALHARYSGNPLALKIVSETIRELFLGQIGDFLRAETILFGGIADLLSQQFGRLSPLEQELMLWLAIEREPVEVDDLRADLLQPVAKLVVLEALQALRQRSLVERTTAGFTLQNVVLEYLTDYLTKQVYDELINDALLLFDRHALLKTQATTYVQESQRTLLLMPIANKLCETLGQQGADERLRAVVADLRHVQLRHTQLRQLGYAGGNLLNLLVQINGNLCGLDFSRLTIRQADLRMIDAQDVDFHGAALSESVFTDTFTTALCVAFSPDGEQLAAGTIGNDLCIWSIKDGQPRLTCSGHASFINSVCFSPDGCMLASASEDHTVRLWDARSGKCLDILQGHTNQVNAVCFSPDGRLLASGGWDQSVRLWDTSSRQCLATLSGHTSAVRSICFSPDGCLLASGSWDQTVRLWDVSSWQCLVTLLGHTDAVYAICFHPDGSLIASSSRDQTVRLWDRQSGQPVAMLQGYTSPFYSIAFSPNGRWLVCGGMDTTLRLWDMQSQQWIALLQGHTSEINSVCFSPTGTLFASASWDQTVRLWNVESRRCVAILQGYKNEVKSVCFQPAGCAAAYLLACGRTQGDIALWDGENGRSLQQWQGHSSIIEALCFSPADAHGGHWLASCGDDQVVRVWEINSGQSIAVLQGHSFDVYTICFSPNRRILASAGWDQTVRLWETSGWQCVTILNGHKKSVHSVCFSPDGNLLASGSDDHTVRLWRVQSGECLATLHGHSRRIATVCFSPDGRTLASGSSDQTIRLWDTETWQCVAILQGETGRILSLCFSPDGRTLASSGGDQSVCLWDVQSGQCQRNLHGHEAEVLSISFSPDGRILASGGADEIIRLWDTQTGECLRTLRSDRPYERMNITGATGLTPAQVATLKALGAVEETTK